MREDILTNEELVRALAEYLRKDIIKNNNFLDQEINNIYLNINYELNDYKINNLKGTNDNIDILDV